MVMNEFWVAAIVPAVIACGVIAALRASRLATRLADHPNERSLHAAPMPRIGGVAIALAVAPFAAAHAHGPLAAAFGAAAVLALVSLADDVHSLPVEVRLPAHAIAALVVVLAMAGPPVLAWPGGWLGAALGGGWPRDGRPTSSTSWTAPTGLAGAMASIGFGVLALGALQGGFGSSRCFAPPWPRPPRVPFLERSASAHFHGRCGIDPSWDSSPAHSGPTAHVADAWPAWFPLLVFSPFVVDATLTLARRVAARERFWVAHRSHAYQRLVLAGWSHRRLALAACALMVAAGASALLARAGSAMLQCGILFVWAVAYALLVAAIRSITRRKA
jgi:hypothetical protein